MAQEGRPSGQSESFALGKPLKLTGDPGQRACGKMGNSVDGGECSIVAGAVDAAAKLYGETRV